MKIENINKWRRPLGNSAKNIVRYTSAQRYVVSADDPRVAKHAASFLLYLMIEGIQNLVALDMLLSQTLKMVRVD